MNPTSASAASVSWFTRLTRPLIGDLTWKPPGWAASLQAGFGRRPIWALFVLLVLFGFSYAGWRTWDWYAHQPKPPTVGWIITMAETSEPDTEFYPQVLTVSFDQSVISLDLIGKDISSLVTLSPKMKGKWTCLQGSRLQFEPAENWPAARTCTIAFSPKLFSEPKRIETLTKEFHTSPFSVAISDQQFYINPKDPSIKQVTATLTFSHPVDRASLEKNLRLQSENGVKLFGDSARARCMFTYDKLDRIAYVRSENVSVPHESAHVIFTVPDSVITVAGGAGLAVEQTCDVLVPSYYDLFHISSAETTIVTNSENEPEQALMVTTSVAVKTDALARAIHAWVLPKPKKRHDPNADQDADQWDSGAEVTSDVLAKATPVALVPVPTEEEFDTTHSFKLKVPENQFLYVTVDKGLEAVGGFSLGDKFDTVGKIPPYPRDVHIMHDGSLLALSGERKLSLESRGVGQLEFRLDRVTPASINHLVSQSSGDFQSPIFEHYNFDESDICEHIVRNQTIAAADTSRNDYSALDFSEFMDGRDGNRGKLGLFILRVLGREAGKDGGYYKDDGSVVPNPVTHPPSPNDVQYRNGRPIDDPTDADDMLADRRLILVTDLGLIIKDNADGTHDVFVQSIKTGEPVDGAQIDVLGKNGLPVVSVKTDDTGHAAVPSLRDFKRERTPVAYVARRDDDVSFLPFDRQDRVLNLSRFDVSGVAGLAAHDLTAFVFTDRGIYRPGDTAQLGLVVKQRDWQGKLDGVPLRLDVIDPRGTVVESRLLKLNAGGFLEAAFPTRDTSATGKYQVNCYLVKNGGDGTLLGSGTLRVSEFLPDRMKIKAKLSATVPEGWINAAGLKAFVSLENLYGAPAAGHRVTGKIMLDPSQFSFDRYPDYTFLDPYFDPKANREAHQQDLPDQTTNDTGDATFDLTMANMEPSAYRLSFLAEGFEKEGGRSVTTGAEVLVSPREWLVGTKPDGDFCYVQMNSRRTVTFLAVDPTLKPISVDHLKLKLIERRFVSVLVQKPNGNYAYQSVLKEIPVSEEELAIGAKGLAWPLKTTQPGDFAARLYDHGDLVADVRYSVVGSGNQARALEKNAELTAKLSKSEYMPGDEVEVEITAPYTGAGLLTIERDKVYAQAWFQAKTTTSVQKIRLPKDFEGNGYLNIAFVRALDSREIYMSPLSYAVLPFKVNEEARHTHITIDVPKVARLGEPLPMTITASRPTQAVIYAVDEGILQVADYQLPDPLGYFFRKQALEVGTRQTVDLILPEYDIVKELAAPGGDAGEDALAHHLNPFKRKHDAPVAYWSGIVDIGPQAKTFTYHVPDYFAGTIRVMVVANTAAAVGAEQATTQVRGPFVISPNVPTFVAPGDEFDVSVTIANNIAGSGPTAPVKLTMDTTDGLEVSQRPEETSSIPEGKDACFHWVLKAKNVLGNADITVTAEGGGQRSSLTSHLSIRPPVPYLTTLTTGYFKGEQKRVDLTRKLYPEYRKATALISPLPQGLSRGLGEYLEHYDYGCTEQLVSKAFPSLVSSDLMQQGLPRAEVATHVAEILDVAATRQNDEGAIGLWTVTPDLHFDLPSAWVVLFMTEAKDQGYDVPDDLLNNALAHLKQDANATAADFCQARTQAFDIYLLARNGIVVTNALEHNRHWFETNAKKEWNDDIAAVYEAAAYALLKNQDQANALISRFHLRTARIENYRYWNDFDNELDRSAQYIYLLSLHFPDRIKTLTGDDLMALADPIMAGDYTTLSSAQAILALDGYGRIMKDKLTPGGFEIDQLAGTALKQLELSPGFYPEGSVGPDADALLFKNTTSGIPGVFYQVSECGFDRGTTTQEMSNGLEISREYRDAQDHPTTTARLGDELTVVLHVRAIRDSVSNVAIEDLLPGGFEIVEESARTGECSYGWSGISYVDVREDRLLAFGDIGNDETTITYRIKATNGGTYAVPPPQAEAMYHQKIRARGVSGTLTVTNQP